MEDLFIIQNLRTLKNNLCFDNLLQKYVLCGEDFSVINDIPNKEMLLLDRIKNTPQINEMENEELTKIIMFKDYSKVEVANRCIQNNIINILLYVPIRLNDFDYRVYLIEDRIKKIIGNTQFKGISNLNYIEGRFLDSGLKRYVLYKMTYIIQEGDINRY